MLRIGPYTLDNRVVLAPMAGVTDRPFRTLCYRLGAGMTVSEMVTADKRLWHTPKSRLRLDHSGEHGLKSVQIAGGDPDMLADAARANADHGAELIDINMGCPAKKVCNKAAGSALMRNEALVERILEAVVNAVSIPVTLKMRTGWSEDNRNAVRIARMAEQAGIQALAVHGRTRTQRYEGAAEYATIAAVKQAVSIPVIANGDIDSPEKAVQVLENTGADGLMIGRPAQGNPWIFRDIVHYLNHGERLPPVTREERALIMHEHLDALYAHYGEHMGTRIARKHVGWYLAAHASMDAKKAFNTLESPSDQHAFVDDVLSHPLPHTLPDGTVAA
ncbi:tRNA dihydrouridine synthase DusB [Larsenimonas salina]|uniref:tRNA dihydrouridine synthase DusB n=1 Tax=Larsenimonas salina TaxID=1295565 RepID=UPI0020748E15|nr:tRNA dihydrouridine synthase DusB [Larsenimonas salina]MCM5703342.1 tRNA dihydrouridine synthase DusB [Larsenimonas salina]